MGNACARPAGSPFAPCLKGTCQLMSGRALQCTLRMLLGQATKWQYVLVPVLLEAWRIQLATHDKLVTSQLGLLLL